MPGSGILSLLRPRWGWGLASGAVKLLFGFLAFSMPVGAVLAMTLLFGAGSLRRPTRSGAIPPPASVPCPLLPRPAAGRAHRRH